MRSPRLRRLPAETRCLRRCLPHWHGNRLLRSLRPSPEPRPQRTPPPGNRRHDAASPRRRPARHGSRVAILACLSGRRTKPSSSWSCLFPLCCGRQHPNMLALTSYGYPHFAHIARSSASRYSLDFGLGSLEGEQEAPIVATAGDPRGMYDTFVTTGGVVGVM